MKNIIRLSLLTVFVIAINGPTYSADIFWDGGAEGGQKKPTKLEQLLSLLHKSEGLLDTGGVSIASPYHNTLFPPEIAAPTFHWKDDDARAKSWLLRFESHEQHPPLYVITQKRSWTPSEDVWETIKTNSVTQSTEFSVFAFSGKRTFTLSSQDSIHFSISTDRVDASILYRQVLLPFKTGKQYIRKMKWRLGDISSYKTPPTVMEKLPVCASCHTVSRDGSLLSMEMNYRNDSGAQFIAPVEKEITLSEKDFFTWNDFPRPEILPKTRGVFARMSPSGKYVVSTVNEIAYMALTNDPAFSQLFFPTHGLLAWYAVHEKTFHPLPGADDHRQIQTGPAWSPDEQYIAFSRADTRNEYHEDITNIRIQIEDADIHELNKKFPIQFDMYRIPFNNGKGGKAEPLQGASKNGKSNYFPRYSPDGRWIVFTQSPTGIMLQPDSKLYIVPADGGEAREMNCNRGRFNSWHSWSPNGRWLLFSSKAHSMYTEIFLTHIDENGIDSPPVRLSRFSEKSYAANLPEFVNIKPGNIKKIMLK